MERGADRVPAKRVAVRRCPLSPRQKANLAAAGDEADDRPDAADEAFAQYQADRDIVRIEQELSDALTASVEIRVKKRTARGEQGEVVIGFGSLDELNGLLDKLGLTRP